MEKLIDDVCKSINKLNDQLTNLSEVYNVNATRKWHRRTISQLPQALVPCSDMEWLHKYNISGYKLSDLQYMIVENVEEFSTFSYDMYVKLNKIINNMYVYLDKIKQDQLDKEKETVL